MPSSTSSALTAALKRLLRLPWVHYRRDQSVLFVHEPVVARCDGPIADILSVNMCHGTVSVWNSSGFSSRRVGLAAGLRIRSQQVAHREARMGPTAAAQDKCKTNNRFYHIQPKRWQPITTAKVGTHRLLGIGGYRTFRCGRGLAGVSGGFVKPVARSLTSC